MAISLDNSIIDFATISNIITTLNTHEDQFQSFESNSLARITDTSSGSNAAVSSIDLNAISVQIAAVRVSCNVGSTVGVNYGVTFSSQPVVIATVEYGSATASTGLVAQIVPLGATTATANGNLGGTQVCVVDLKNASGSAPTVVNIIAIGQR
jgi:hypothetical protein